MSNSNTLSWSIDRETTKTKKKFTNKIIENFPNAVCQMVVEEVLKLVGIYDWNDPMNVSKTIAEIMSIDLTKEPEEQKVKINDMIRTVCVPSKNDKTIPFWICQSIIRIDPKYRYINYKGSKYNKLDIIFESEYFKEQMDKVAKYANCTWNVRSNNPSIPNPQTLYQETRTGYSKFNYGPESESWLAKCSRHLHTDEDVNGINIKNLMMFEFRRKE